jgi:putative RecB family exonuclease
MPEALIPPPHLSPSSMGTFNQCPMKFRFSKIDKLPDEPSEATLLGNFVHDFCEQFYMFDPEERIEALINPLFSEVWNSGNWEERIHPYVRGEKHVRQFKWRAVWCVENLWKIENPSEIEPEGLEYELNGKVNGVTLKGFIDRFTVVDGGITISDYKTGKTPNPYYGNDKFLQLKIYGALIDELGVGTTKKLELLYLKDGVKFDQDFTESDFTETVAYITDTKKAIDIACETHVFDTNKTALCNWCAYKPQCPAWS